MLNTLRAVMEEGEIKLLEKVEIPEGTEVLVTLLFNKEDFWTQASETSLNAIWDNPEDDIYEYFTCRIM